MKSLLSLLMTSILLSSQFVICVGQRVGTSNGVALKEATPVEIDYPEIKPNTQTKSEAEIHISPLATFLRMSGLAGEQPERFAAYVRGYQSWHQSHQQPKQLLKNYSRDPKKRSCLMCTIL